MRSDDRDASVPGSATRATSRSVASRPAAHTTTPTPTPPRSTAVYVRRSVLDPDMQLGTTRWWRVVPVVAMGLMLGTLDQSAVGVVNTALAVGLLIVVPLALLSLLALVLLPPLPPQPTPPPCS